MTQACAAYCWRENKITFIIWEGFCFIYQISGDKVNKFLLISIIALLVIPLAGCAQPGGQGTATPSTAPSATAPITSSEPPLPSEAAPGSAVSTTQPSTAATPTSAANWLSGYKETSIAREQYMTNGMKARLESFYTTPNWTMPFPLGGQGTKSANHGAIIQVKFYNPTSSAQEIVLDTDVKSSIWYVDANHKQFPLVTADMFYDPSTGRTFMQTSVAPGETKTMWILGYISNDDDYDNHSSSLQSPTLELNPRYTPQ